MTPNHLPCNDFGRPRRGVSKAGGDAVMSVFMSCCEKSDVRPQLPSWQSQTEAQTLSELVSRMECEEELLDQRIQSG